MRDTNRRLAYLFWVLAGIPILAVVLQASFAFITLQPRDLPIFDQVSIFLRQIEVFDVAALVLQQVSVVVLLAFILIMAAWVTVGFTIYASSRNVAISAALIVTSFAVAFVFAYNPVFRADLPIAQLVGFGSIAVLTVLSTWIGVILGVHTDTDKEPRIDIEDIANIKTQIQDNQETFHCQLSDRLDHNTQVSIKSISQNLFDEIELAIKEFHHDCELLEKEVDGLQNKNIEQQQRMEAIKDIQTRVAELRPIESVDMLALECKIGIHRALRQTFSQSALSQEDLLVIQTILENELEFEANKPISQKKDLVNVIDDVFATEQSLNDYIPAIGNVFQDQQLIIETQRGQQTDLFIDVATCQANLDQITSNFQRVPGVLGRTLQDRFNDRDAVSGSVASIQELNESIPEVIQAIHNGDIDEARLTVDSITESLESLEIISAFWVDVARDIYTDQRSTPIPSEVSPSSVQELLPIIERTYGIDCTVDDDALIYAPDLSSQDTMGENSTVPTLSDVQTESLAVHGGEDPDE